MSTNSADMNREYFTVAELVERERSDTESYPWAVRQRSTRGLTPAADLLRREGVRIDGMPEPDAEDKQHVAKLLRREGELRQEEDKRGGKVAALAGAAAISGLTIAGLLALTPGSSTPTANTAAGGGAADQAGAVPIDSASTTPSSTVLKRASNEQDRAADKQRDNRDDRDDRGSATGAGGGHATDGGTGSGAGNGGGDTGGAPGTTPDEPQQPNDPPRPPSDDTPAPKPPQDPQPNNPVGDIVGGVTDTVGGVVGGVTDTVGGVLNPVTGSLSGTLPLG